MKRANVLSWIFIASAAVLTGSAASSQSTLPPVLTDPADIERARVSCDAGDFDNCYAYGRAMLASNAPQTLADVKRAYDSLEKACNGGAALACYGSGWRYIQGNGIAINLKKARKLEVKGCDSGDDRACGVVNRLDNPPFSAAFIKGLPPVAQGNLNMALYVEAGGAERLAQYADNDAIAANPDWHWNLQAASCEMGHVPACTRAALGFMDGPGYVNPYKKDMPRSVGLLRLGCAGDDGIACYTLGNALVMQNGSMGSEATAAYVKSRPHMQKACDEGIKNGYGCSFLGYMGEFSIGVDYRPDEVEANYARGCELGFASSCSGLASFREKRAIADAPRLEREKWANGAQSKQYCDGLVSQWNAEAASTQADYAALDARRAKTQTANGANNVFAEMTSVKRQGCYALLAITKQGKYTCQSHYEDMLHSGRKIHGGLEDCAVQLREMDAEYHRTFG